LKFLSDFFKQQAPKAGTEMPAYYRGVLLTCEKLMALYFALSVFFIARATFHWEIMPIALFVVALLHLWEVDQLSPRANLALYVFTTVVWCGWYAWKFGWSTGAQSFLIPLLVLEFFNIYDSPWLKVTTFGCLIGYRMLLFALTLTRTPVYELDEMARIHFQVLNTATLFACMAAICIHFSGSLQEVERQLRLDNQALHKEAGTDPLTQLPNRRAMMDIITAFQKDSPHEIYCVAIADIDFFKKVNDTYGHACGDYTLKALADRFREAAGKDYRVCRWGGEEFCFFLPGKNLDEAGGKMIDLNVSVGRMPLSFEGVDFSITITVGVAEWDFASGIDTILEDADRKLYMGKEAGRDRVVI